MNAQGAGIATIMWKAGGTVAWGGCMFAALNFHRGLDEAALSLCGPWGCGAPTGALIGWHACCLLILLPILLGVCLWLPPRWAFRGSALLTASAILGLLTVVSWEAIQWGWLGSEMQHKYVVQRCLFVVANLIDIPLLQFMVLGTIGMIFASMRGKALTGCPAQPQQLDASGEGEQANATVDSKSNEVGEGQHESAADGQLSPDALASSG